MPSIISRPSPRWPQCSTGSAAQGAPHRHRAQGQPARQGQAAQHLAVLDDERAVVEDEVEVGAELLGDPPRRGMAAAGHQDHAHAAPRAPPSTAARVRGEIVLSLRSSVPSMSRASRR